jgi:hypothetical protein
VSGGLITALMKAGSQARMCSPRADTRQTIELVIEPDGIKAMGIFKDGAYEWTCSHLVHWKSLDVDPNLASVAVLTVERILAGRIKGANLPPVAALGGPR